MSSPDPVFNLFSSLDEEINKLSLPLFSIDDLSFIEPSKHVYFSLVDFDKQLEDFVTRHTPTVGRFINLKELAQHHLMLLLPELYRVEVGTQYQMRLALDNCSPECLIKIAVVKSGDADRERASAEYVLILCSIGDRAGATFIVHDLQELEKFLRPALMAVRAVDRQFSHTCELILLSQRAGPRAAVFAQ